MASIRCQRRDPANDPRHVSDPLLRPVSLSNQPLPSPKPPDPRARPPVIGSPWPRDRDSMPFDRPGCGLPAGPVKVKMSKSFQNQQQSCVWGIEIHSVSMSPLHHIRASCRGGVLAAKFGMHGLAVEHSTGTWDLDLGKEERPRDGSGWSQAEI